jgi:flagellar motor switch protein FliN/FliY
MTNDHQTTALTCESNPENPQGNSAEAGFKPMLRRLMDLELPLAVTLGRAVLPIEDILKISSGSLIELDRSVGEYVDLMVQGTIVARGEIVSVKGNYGVRIKEIISRQDRLALREVA